MKTTFPEPLEIASIPKAPVPANGSKIVLLIISNCSQLNNVSLTLPEVGRSSSESLKKNFLPFRLPEIILKVLVLMLSNFDEKYVNIIF